VTLEELVTRVPYLAGLPEEQLEALCGAELEVAAGEVLFEEGSSSDAAYLVLDGSFEVARSGEQGEVVIGTAAAGELLGELSLLTGAPRSGTVRAAGPSRVVALRAAGIDGLLGHPPAVRAMLAKVVARLRETELAVVHAEKMVALGTMAAGLIHELNNPASAVKRGADHLAAALDDLWTDERAEPGGDADLEEAPPRTADARAGAGALAAADREDEVQELLEQLGLDDAWELAPALAAAGWDAGLLRSEGLVPDDPAAPHRVRRLAARSAVEQLVTEIGVGAGRLMEIVGAVKRYAHVGEAPIGTVDIREGLADTLVVMRHRLRDVEVVTDLADDLPEVEVFGTELNQVWTNLIDNAVDAMEGHGRLVLRGVRDGDGVEVEITDDGPGIPEEVRTRLFDPFFTTKAPGHGTGLGLHIAQRVVARHGGRIDVRTGDEGTTFRVRLPARLPRTADPGRRVPE
jgi:signal transduction histidine kinase